MRVRHRHRLRKVLFWGAAVVLSSLAGGLGFAYYYVTDSETLARFVRTEGARFLPGSFVDLARARVKPFLGEIYLTNLTAHQPIDGAPFRVARLPWLSLKYDPWAMFEGRFEPSEVNVAQPTFRLCQRGDGTWNFQGLLASPWPGPAVATPPIQIKNGTVELCPREPGAPPMALLRDVDLRIEPAGPPGQLTFDGSAKGDTFDRLSVKGTVDVATGRVELEGDVARLALAEPLRSRVPAEFRPAVEASGVSGGEVDLRVDKLAFDPAASAGDRLRYDVSGRLREVAWNCPKLPLPVNDVSAVFAARDGLLTVERAEGYFGTTTVRLDRGTFALGDPASAPFEAELEVVNLMLDETLRRRTPPEAEEVWRSLKPSGTVSVRATVRRKQAGGKVEKRTVVDCHDVSVLYEHFKYPLDHVRGRVVWEGDRVVVEGLSTLVGGRALVASGTIDRPGPNAVVALDFRGEALPVDRALIEAMPPDVREVVELFRPSGSVRGDLRLRRSPPETPGDDPRGKVEVDATIQLNEGCRIVWKEMPYPVNSLTGTLILHPDVWEFKGMRGVNGQAVITGSGRVRKVRGAPPKKDLDVALNLQAEKLPFDGQLLDALPPAWKKTWAILDPTGSSDVKAAISVGPGRPDSYVLDVDPRPATGVRLRIDRAAGPGAEPGKPIEFRMEDVKGRFAFNNGPVDMTDVSFRFHGTPVQFAKGSVTVADSGQFLLGVDDLWVKGIRLDAQLRQDMPPVMAQFAQRLDDGKTFTVKGNLGLGWSGQPGEPVWCRWDDALVVLNDNAVQIQPGMGLEHIQGQLDHVKGWTDGRTFELHGALNLDSVSLLGQQVTRLESPIDVKGGVASLGDVRGQLLGGDLTGSASVSLDDTPRYSAAVDLRGADLRHYAETLPGRQTFRGRVDASLKLQGFGGDPRTLQGSGRAHVFGGELGELPVFLRLVGALNLRPISKIAFDSADVTLAVRDGETRFDPIKFTGNAFSLQGAGTMDVQGDLDLRLRVLYGRDRLRLPLINDALREASGQFLIVRGYGTVAFPQFKLVPFPEAADAVKALSRRRVEKEEAGRR